jgi:hypothetical protein
MRTISVSSDPRIARHDCPIKIGIYPPLLRLLRLPLFTFYFLPFPALEEGPLKSQLRELGERRDAHRKRQQALHPHLTRLVALSARFGRANKIREEQIEGILETLRGLGLQRAAGVGLCA